MRRSRIFFLSISASFLAKNCPRGRGVSSAVQGLPAKPETLSLSPSPRPKDLYPWYRSSALIPSPQNDEPDLGMRGARWLVVSFFCFPSILIIFLWNSVWSFTWERLFSKNCGIVKTQNIPLVFTEPTLLAPSELMGGQTIYSQKSGCSVVVGCYIYPCLKIYPCPTYEAVFFKFTNRKFIYLWNRICFDICMHSTMVKSR